MKSWPLSLRLGLGLLVGGTGPLLLFLIADELGLISDPNPNPIGLGLLFFFTIWPAVGLTVFGLARRIWASLARC
jgi:hypothetical protein